MIKDGLLRSKRFTLQMADEKGSADGGKANKLQTRIQEGLLCLQSYCRAWYRIESVAWHKLSHNSQSLGKQRAGSLMAVIPATGTNSGKAKYLDGFWKGVCGASGNVTRFAGGGSSRLPLLLLLFCPSPDASSVLLEDNCWISYILKTIILTFFISGFSDPTC